MTLKKEVKRRDENVKTFQGNLYGDQFLFKLNFEFNEWPS